jgi:lysophospholipase L1-like esterase
MPAKNYTILTSSILILISLVFSIAIAEIICRIIPFSNDSDPTYKLAHDILPYAMKPNSESTSIHGNLIKINSHGLRDHEYSFEKAEGIFRILVLGDSVEFGFGSKMEDGYTELLERQLNALANKKYKAIEIINTGHPVFNTLDRYNYLRLYGLKYSPDLLVISLNSSDFAVGSSKREVIDGIDSTPGSFLSNFPPWVKRFLRKSHLYIATGWWVRELRHHFQKEPAPAVHKKVPTEKLEATRNYLDNFISVGLINKLPVYFAFMVSRQEVMSKTLNTPEFYEQIKNLEKEGKAVVLNMLEPLGEFSDKTDEVFAHKDPSHPNARGHQIIAGHLFHELATHILIRKTP